MTAYIWNMRVSCSPCLRLPVLSMGVACSGTYAVHALGRVEYLAPGFHCRKYIWPVGYCATRIVTVPGSGKPGRQLAVRCQVLQSADGGGPVFRRASDKSACRHALLRPARPQDALLHLGCLAGYMSHSLRALHDGKWVSPLKHILYHAMLFLGSYGACRTEV